MRLDDGRGHFDTDWSRVLHVSIIAPLTEHLTFGVVSVNS